MSKKNHKKSTSLSKNFTFNRFFSVGAPDAESEKRFSEYFIENDIYLALKDIEHPGCILVGRTGSGKSAVIRKLEETERKVTRIIPEAMSLRYLNNSNIIGYFTELGVNLNFFYKLLWKHVFLVEILKIYLDDNEIKKQTFFETLRKSILNKNGKPHPQKEKALKYLHDWSEEFWQNTEYRIRSLENSLEENFLNEAGLDVNAIKAKHSTNKSNSTKENIEIKHKAEKVINEIQANELFSTIEMMKNEVFKNSNKKYFILIDDLDKDWIKPQLSYDLIAAMIEVIKEFQSSFVGVKISIGLRDNLHQLVFSGNEHRGGQREKLQPLYLEIIWNKQSLVELLDKRLQISSNNKLSIHNLFEKQTGLKDIAINYILDRTYNRPRDIILFVNRIVEKAETRSHLNMSVIKKAEPYYSVDRFNALEDEWEENYGKIGKICNFLMGINDGFNFINIKEEPFSDIYLAEDLTKIFKGELLKITLDWKRDIIDFKVFKSKVFFILYRIGILGIKRRPDSPLQFYFEPLETITVEDFNQNAKIHIHKSLFSVFKINHKEQQIESYN